MRIVLGMLLGVVATLVVQFALFASAAPSISSVEASQSRFDVEVRLREQFLGELVREELRGTDLGQRLHESRVDAQPGGNLRLLARTTLMIVDVPVAAALQPRVQDGRLAMTVTQVQVAGVALPEDLGSALEKRLDATVQQAIAREGVRVVGAHTDEDSLIVRLQVEPRAR